MDLVISPDSFPEVSELIAPLLTEHVQAIGPVQGDRGGSMRDFKLNGAAPNCN